jgi:hypothetical protein
MTTVAEPKDDRTVETRGPRHFKHRWLTAVGRCTALDYDVRGLLLAMAETWMAPDGMNCFPTQGTIAKECGGSREKVNRLLGKAQAAGLIAKEYRPTDKGVIRLHWTPVIPGTVAVSPQTSVAVSPQTTVAVSPHITQVREPREGNPDLALAREGPGQAASLPFDESELLVLADAETVDDIADRDRKCRLVDLVIAVPMLSQHSDVLAEQTRRIVGPCEDPLTLVDEIRQEEYGPSAWLACVTEVVGLTEAARVTRRIRDSEVVRLVDFALDLLPDRSQRTAVLDEATMWDDKRSLGDPVAALEGRIRKIAADRMTGGRECRSG